MKLLTDLISTLGKETKTLSIRGLLYDSVEQTSKGTYLFTHSQSSDQFETQLSFLHTLYQDGRLFNPEYASVVQDKKGFSKRHTSKTSLISSNKTSKTQSMYGLSSDETMEFEELLREMRPMNFVSSKQLSNYIVKHKLGNKYPNISGIARMSNGEREWNFEGGFPPEIYKIICQELDLCNQGTRSRVVGFSSFASLR
ncbi:hypothetical protein [Photobacterium leiognathi]|uniref:Uncharacterized protein n=1 Tax=Photobacterium leiognathi TaxID=553611 RepID=A0ABX5GKQ8_PHOLE|nr:hypothetical protein [Photobacterium leiognathi]PSV86351.1 hypothetical protein CTM94_00650 [Photobacterium leiognathi]